MMQLANMPERVAMERELMLQQFDEKASQEKGDMLEALERVRASIGIASSRVLLGVEDSSMAVEVDPDVVAALREAKHVEADLSGCLMGSPISRAQAALYSA